MNAVDQKNQVSVNLIRHIEDLVLTVLDGQTNVTLGREFAEELIKSGLLKESAVYRESIYHGEKYVLHYEFSKRGGDKTERYAGFLGFNEDFRLITIDERLPAWKVNHLGKNK